MGNSFLLHCVLLRMRLGRDVLGGMAGLHLFGRCISILGSFEAAPVVGP